LGFSLLGAGFEKASARMLAGTPRELQSAGVVTILAVVGFPTPFTEAALM